MTSILRSRGSLATNLALWSKHSLGCVRSQDYLPQLMITDIESLGGSTEPRPGLVESCRSWL